MTNHREVRIVLTWIFISTILLASALGATTVWNEPPFLDPALAIRGPLVDDYLWHDSAEDNRIYMPILKSRIPEGQQRVQLREAMEMVKRWLNSHVKSSGVKGDNVDGDGDGRGSIMQAQTKRNGSGYMCHFKLCQLGASNSGKRRWNPSSYQ